MVNLALHHINLIKMLSAVTLLLIVSGHLEQFLDLKSEGPLNFVGSKEDNVNWDLKFLFNAVNPIHNFWRAQLNPRNKNVVLALNSALCSEILLQHDIKKRAQLWHWQWLNPSLLDLSSACTNLCIWPEEQPTPVRLPCASSAAPGSNCCATTSRY